MRDEFFMSKVFGTCVAILLLSLGLCVSAFAQSGCPFVLPSNAQANCNTFLQPPFAGTSGVPVTGSVATITGPNNYQCLLTGDPSEFGAGGSFLGGGQLVQQCPASCAGLPNQDIMAAISQSSFNSGGLICVNSCGYTNSASSMSVGVSGSSTTLEGQAIPTGAACTAGAGSVSALSTSNCMESGGTIACHQSASNVATVNNDILNPAAPPAPGGCAAYADGAVECNAGTGGTFSVVAGPTTSGVLDTPAATVVSASNTLDYFTPAQVAASGTPVLTMNAGNVSGNPAGTTLNGTVPCTPSAAGVTPVITCSGLSTGGGTGAGTGTCTPSAAGVTPVVTCSGTGTGDCDAPSSASTAGCTDGPLPSLTRTDTAVGDATAMWSGIQSTPLFQAFNSISTAFGSGGSCPTASVTFTTIKFTGDFMASFCAAFTGLLPTMIAISDAAWCVLGLLILLSA
jgi:hypothetical protein